MINETREFNPSSQLSKEGPVKKEIGDSLKIIIAGPPHSGKSIAENYLRNLLPPQDTMRIAAQPDGEGDWTQNIYKQDEDLAQKLRHKGKFTPENVETWKQQITNTTNRFTLIDVGGVISPENQEICQQANAMIIVSSNSNKTEEWIDLAEKTGLHILSVLNSTLEPQNEWFKKTPNKKWETEGLVVGLDRGKFKDSSTLRELASYLLEKMPAKDSKEIDGYSKIDINQIANMIGKKEEEIILPGREPTKGLNWKPEELLPVYIALQKLAEKGGNFVIDGRMPQFLAINILHALHPNKIALADSKVEGGMVGISGQNHPKSEGSGPLPFSTTKNFHGGTLVEYSKNQFTIIDNKQLNKIIPPATESGKPIFLSGKTSNWAAAEIALSYTHIAPAIYLYQPGTGFICVATHNINHKLGEVIVDNP